MNVKQEKINVICPHCQKEVEIIVGEKKYICPYCEKNFVYKKNTEEGENPTGCAKFMMVILFVFFLFLALWVVSLIPMWNTP
ncbi:MAG: hypothetical protein SVM86_00655 [Candidatus Cloacimonadota bacterium]|nr:hypothetical protein [Candidatus Cloacimonadota bacterium]